MGLVLDWRKKLGYKRDPFQHQILRPSPRFIVGFGKQMERFNLFLIKDERLATITGPPGTGKTTFLAWIIDVLKPSSYQVDFIDARKATKQVALIDTLLAENSSLLTRRGLLKKPAERKYKLLLKRLTEKQHVVLVDNAGSLTREGLALFYDIIEKTRTHVILADETLNVPKADAQLSTPKYPPHDLALVLQKRIEDVGSKGTFPFDEKELKRLVEKARGNPVTLLTLAKERAIELSLKVTKTPEPAKEKPRPGIEVKRFGFINLRIDRSDEE